MVYALFSALSTSYSCSFFFSSFSTLLDLLDRRLLGVQLLVEDLGGRARVAGVPRAAVALACIAPGATVVAIHITNVFTVPGS